MKTIFALLVAFAFFVPVLFGQQIEGLEVDDDGDEIINKVREHFKKHPEVASWKPGKTTHSHRSKRFKQSQCGTIIEPREKNLQDPHVLPSHNLHRTIPNIPTSFDARVNWPNCASIKEIRDQGNCGSCWAHAGASTISDRVCIKSSNQSTYFQAAVQDPLVCGSGNANVNLCNGGPARLPFVMYTSLGIVSGSGATNIQNVSGCMYYKAWSQASAAATLSSSCDKTCSNPGYSKTYAQDKRYGSNWYAMGNQFISTGGAGGAKPLEPVVQQIQFELMTNGPISVSIANVSDDFFAYQSGVYRQITPGNLGGHAMKLIGWGVENNADYWLIANSWGIGWGNLGFLKFVRGENHMGIENYLVTGIPQAENAVPTTPGTVLPCTNSMCTGKPFYPIYPLGTCTAQVCVCTTNGTAVNAVIGTCGTGNMFDPTPGVFNCVPQAQVPGCGATTVVITTTTTTTTTPAPGAPTTTPPLAGRPPGYDRCDPLFCGSHPTGYYAVSPCGKNFCSCNNGAYTWYGCTTGQFFDGVTCKAPNATWCAPKTAVTTPASAPWGNAPTNVASMCNLANCNGREPAYGWYTLGLCSPYWCSCSAGAQQVVKCGTGLLFDFRSESAACANPANLVWCP